MLQSWNQLENRRGKDNEMLRRVWKTVETKAGKTEVAKTKGRRERREKEKETKRERVEERRKEKEKTKEE